VTSQPRPPASASPPANPQRVAWSIPVVGKQERLQLLERVVTKLLSSGVKATDIYVMEDNESRNGLLGTTTASTRLAQFTQKYGIHVLQSNIMRDNKRKKKEMNLVCFWPVIIILCWTRCFTTVFRIQLDILEVKRTKSGVGAMEQTQPWPTTLQY
jgi:hypothetical protein